MPDDRNIDDLLNDWSFEPQAVNVRVIEGNDGRDVIQLRIEMGVMQLETSGRPDGSHPNEMDTFFDYLIAREISDGDDFELSDDECMEVDREFVQFYHRRICWLALREYERAAADADHTLGLMDICRKHSRDKEWAAAHEHYRPFVLFHRTQALALADLKRSGAEEAIVSVNRGLDSIQSISREGDEENSFEAHELINRLVELRESLREQFDVGKTLQEQLEEAIAAEQYELAAQLRDQMNGRHQ